MKQHVVVIGGGYAGAKTVKKLSLDPMVDITLIDQNRFHYLQAETHEFIAGITRLEDVIVDLKKFCRQTGKQVTFRQAHVDAIEFDDNRIRIKDEYLGYDYLVIATGATTLFPKGIKGIDRHALDIKSLGGALSYRQTFESFLFRQYGYGEHFNVIVGGAGLSGVEIITEMAERARKMGFGPEAISFTLVEPMETVLPGMDRFLITQTVRRLRKLKITAIHGHFISEVKEKSIVLSNGDELPSDLFIFTAGIAIEEPSKDAHVSLNPRGQILVDAYMRLEGHENVFVVGDVAEQKNSAGSILPPTSQAAKLGARRVAGNILAHIHGEPLEPNDANMRGIVVALGGHHAAAVLFGSIKLPSPFAYWLKKLIFFLHSLSLKRLLP